MSSLSLQEPQTLNALIPTQVNYLIFLPKHYGIEPEHRWPLLLYLHGIGQRGDDITLLQNQHALMSKMQQDTFPFVVLTPQCPARSSWLCQLAALNALLDHILATYAIDTQRVSVTGISAGAMAAWHLPIMYPERFAATIPVAGWCPREERERIPRMKGVALWAFHGAKDPTMALSEAQTSIERLQAMGGNGKLTVYPEGEHEIWEQVYRYEPLFEWLLQQRRPANSVEQL
jgi:predicted peptidase